MNYGFFVAFVVFVFWGLVPIFYKQLDTLDAFVVMSHRIVWSVIFLAIFLIIIGQFKKALQELKSLKMAFNLFICGALISGDWGLYIYMIQKNLILETSLGYFLSPLFGIIFAKVFLKENMSKLGIISVSLVIFACLFEVITLGALPILSITLALLVNFYTIIRKKVYVSSVYGFFLETLLITPFALIFLFSIPTNLAHFDIDYLGVLLALSGLVTLLPMLGYNYATQKLSLTLLSYMQYICPIISFLVAIFLYNEPINQHKLISFIIIFIAVALSVYDNVFKKGNRL
ncbi:MULTISPECIES: EamA family transporter RarD [unclassified Campylobacter]|uniref:EamA family transporter RarD n=1 Tax=unclassified Campylobacter TaxID=2593542 RepID=UPI001BD9FBC9|nr:MULTISPECIES: EamA family transporter RarD [unclassified Campylobacter]MBT0881131.1 EamA family transporter RarD [Campylobacter sp. 2018MI27]MBT0885223.1 EamA family transporter RarD [Campylobacter sp. 2018MI10]MBZ7976955.1 EamA family transporter RarD [Campylobacter sp. RM12637]MBZ7993312.1 EamA family transporter RarD [Campylobacter sp. RM9333]